MARIYTRTGDAGETGLFGGERVPKDDPRVAAYGEVDELNAALGLALAGDPEIAALERAIDAHEAQLTALSNFILPGGTPKAAALHLARTVCRRAERAVVPLARDGAAPPAVVRYLNRLSDLLFVLARAANAAAGRSDVRW